MKHRKELDDIKTAVALLLRDEHGGYPTYWPCDVRCSGGVTLIRALVWNLRTCPVMQGKRHKRRNREAESTDAPARGGPPRSSVKASVMLGERRRWVTAVEYGSTGNGTSS